MNIEDYELIRKGTVEARDYQLKIVAEVGQRNSIIVLPTGLGKTAIAALMIASSLKARGGKALFLAPTRILVHQHWEYLQKVLELPRGSVTSLTGEDDAISRSDAWEGRVICATPQIAVQDLKRGLYQPSKFAMVVIDEVHRTIGNHSYVQMANTFAQTDAQMIGLTATLPAERERIEEIKQALRASTIMFRDYESDDIQPFVQKVDMELKTLEPTVAMKTATSLLRDALRRRMEAIAREGLISYGAAGRMSFKELLIRRESILGRGSWNARFAYSVSAKLYTMIKYLETQSYASLMNYYERAVQGGKRAASMLQKDPQVSQAVQIIKDELARGVEHPKMAALVELIGTLGESDRALVFAGYRDTVQQIHRALDKSGHRSWTLIGKQGETGQSQEEQVRAVEYFRRGNYQVLVATQVGEEGLDIAECNLVVFYDNVPSAIRYVQRRGRTGRRSEGRMVMLMVRGTSDEAYYWMVQRKLKAAKGYVSRMNSEPKPRRKPGTLDSYV